MIVQMLYSSTYKNEWHIFFATYSTSRKDVECKFGCIHLSEFLQFISWQEKKERSKGIGDY